MNDAPELAERYLGQMLSAWGMDIEYVRAEGDVLYTVDSDGSERAVVDFVGGFGSLIFGHNHPALVGRARQLLSAGTPIHAQLSKRAESQRVAGRLNEIIRREFADDEPFHAVFANTGAEAIEAALKHAELDRAMRAATLSAEIESHIDHAHTEFLGDRAELSPNAMGFAEAAEGDPAAFGKLADELRRRNLAAFSRNPIYLAMEGGFHGKLVGSLQVTHNVAFRTPFAALGSTARFVAWNDAQALKEAFEQNRAVAFDLVLDRGVIDVVAREVPIFGGLFLEPVQGEGGIRVLEREYARQIEEACRANDCPIIIDEIQSGCGRTGSFFASSAVELRGDYFALAKSIGGGIAKTSVLLVRESRYRREFELLHSSTFAKDSFSCALSQEVLQLLEAEGGAAYLQARERGAALRAMLERVHADYSDVVREVRGRGLLLGFEFHDQSDARSPVIAHQARSAAFGFAVSGYLLREHSVRVMPTGSAPNTLRLEPSLFIDDSQIDQLEFGLRQVCQILRDQDALHLVYPCTSRSTPKPREKTRKFDLVDADREDGAADITIGLIGALGSPDGLRSIDASLTDLSDELLDSYLLRISSTRIMTPLRTIRRMVEGQSADITVYPLLISDHDLENPDLSRTNFEDLAVQVRIAGHVGHDLLVLDGGLAKFVDRERLPVPGLREDAVKGEVAAVVRSLLPKI